MGARWRRFSSCEGVIRQASRRLERRLLIDFDFLGLR